MLCHCRLCATVMPFDCTTVVKCHFLHSDTFEAITCSSTVPQGSTNSQQEGNNMKVCTQTVLAIVAGFVAYHLFAPQVERLHGLVDSMVLADFVFRALRLKNST